MIIYGISEGFHDSSLSIIKDNEIVFAAHGERYSKLKNDPILNKDILSEALTSYPDPNKIAYYEDPILKNLRLITYGGIKDKKRYFDKSFFPHIKRTNIRHHLSHAAAGYYTSKFYDAAIVVLDAIGEFNTSTIWVGSGESINLIEKKNYPFSFGLFYSAFTDLIGLKPNQEEYILMGMAGYGDSKKYFKEVDEYFPSINYQKYNFHTGIYDFPILVTEENKFDIAAAVQTVYEDRLIEYMQHVKKITGMNNLVFMGGCALNASANTKLWEIFSDIWIMPNPGDAGSSLGAALAVYGKHINWKGPYLGTKIGNDYPIRQIIDKLLVDKVCAVANGRAEFGPRSLGNRSILADPRDPNIKDNVNRIKQRELFRPFAPVVLEEDAAEWFDMKYSSPYMQYTPKCLKPELIPSVVHIDGTSRVQTVNVNDHSGLYALLKEWKKISGIPVLLNTSLNIKGQPILNDIYDVHLWEQTYNDKIVI